MFHGCVGLRVLNKNDLLDALLDDGRIIEAAPAGAKNCASQVVDVANNVVAQQNRRVLGRLLRKQM
jgi:hypothetical protein